MGRVSGLDRTGAGESYVLGGDTSSGTVDLAADADAAVVIVGGKAGDRSGAALAAGDLSGDGRTELAVVASDAKTAEGRVGRLYLIIVPLD